MTTHHDVGRAIDACRRAGIPVIDPLTCTCRLPGRLVIVSRRGGLRVIWPYDDPCPIHDIRDRAACTAAMVQGAPEGCCCEPHAYDVAVEADLARSHEGQVTGTGKLITSRARELAAQLEQLFDHDAQLAQQLNDTHRRLTQANDRLWTGLHPDGLAAVYGDSPAVLEVCAANRSAVLGECDPLAAVQHVHWTIHRAHSDFQSTAEERRTLAAHTGEIIRAFLDELTHTGWTEQEARNADIGELARPISPGWSGTKASRCSWVRVGESMGHEVPDGGAQRVASAGEGVVGFAGHALAAECLGAGDAVAVQEEGGGPAGGQVGDAAQGVAVAERRWSSASKMVSGGRVRSGWCRRRVVGGRGRSSRRRRR